MIVHPFKGLLAVAVVAGVAMIPAASHAESSKSGKSESVSTSPKNRAATDEFEENRRAHMQKSKENNAKKGAE